MWQQHTQPIPYQTTNQEPPLADFLDGANVIVLIEQEEGQMKVYPFPTLESERRNLVKNANAAKLLQQLDVPHNAPDVYQALTEGRGVLYIKLESGAVGDVFTRAT